MYLNQQSVPDESRQGHNETNIYKCMANQSHVFVPAVSFTLTINQ